MTKANTPATVKRELTKDELLQLSSHAGDLAKEIKLKKVARKDASDKAKVKIDELQMELDTVHEKLRNKFELIPAQMELLKQDPDEEDDLEMPPTDNVTDLASRLDECRSVVQQAKQDIAKEDADLYQRAVELVRTESMITTSVLRRRLKIGKSKATRIIDALYENGMIKVKV